MVKFSIIIPSYNAETTLAETLDSLVSQTYPDWECIILDDHSSDDTKGVVTAYQNRDPRFRSFFFEESKGPSFLRNYGVAQATNPYVVFLDADDLLTPECLAGRNTYICDNLSGNMWIFYMKKFMYDERLVNNHSIDATADELTRRFIVHDLPWAITCVVWLRSFFLEVGGFNEKLKRFTDPCVHIKALTHKNVSVHISPYIQHDCLYRIWDKGNGTLLTKTNTDAKNAIFIFNEWLITFLRQNNLIEKYRSELLQYYRYNLGIVIHKKYDPEHLFAIKKLYAEHKLLRIFDRLSSNLIYVFYVLRPMYLSKRLLYYYDKWVYKYL